jgi:hypothetical protein
VISENHTADWGNQQIVNHRSPMFRRSVDGFLRSPLLQERKAAAVRAIIVGAAQSAGYAVIDPAQDWEDIDPSIVSVAIRSETYELCIAHWCGFTTEINTDSIHVLGSIQAFFGGAAPVYTNLPAAIWESAARFGYPVGL